MMRQQLRIDILSKAKDLRLAPACIGRARNLAGGERNMDLTEWRLKIDELDRQLVELLSERARAAQQIGRLKKSTSLPVYEPNRESVIFANVRAANKGPLPDIELTHIYERIIDVMRALQQEELASQRRADAAEHDRAQSGEQGK